MADQVTRALSLGVAALSIVLAARDSAAQYGVGFAWNRSTDWVAGTAPGRGWQAGNPCRDQAGFQVWSMEYVAGGPLGSANEWFRQQPLGLMVWDASWFGGAAAWSRGDDVAPEVLQQFLTDDQATGANPLVRWSNPVRKAVTVNVSGQFQVSWGTTVIGGTVANAGVDVVLAKRANDGTFTVLLQQSVPKPANNVATLPVSVQNVAIGPSDSLVWSLRTQFNAAPTYANLNDSSIQITLSGPTPCPADFNGVSGVNVQDIFDFLAAWFVGC